MELYTSIRELKFINNPFNFDPPPAPLEVYATWIIATGDEVFIVIIGVYGAIAEMRE